MKITNFSEFYSVIKKLKLQNVDPYKNFVNTVDIYLNMCHCGNITERENTKQKAISQYISLSKGMFSQHARSISPVLIYNNNKLIAKY